MAILEYHSSDTEGTEMRNTEHTEELPRHREH